MEKNNVVKPSSRTAAVPKAYRVLIAEMEDAMLAATADGSVSDRALLDVVSPDGLHCHQLVHRALKALEKEGLLACRPKEGVNDYATSNSPTPRSGGQ